MARSPRRPPPPARPEFECVVTGPPTSAHAKPSRQAVTPGGLAERVDKQPGWRLKLVAVRPSAAKRVKVLHDLIAQARRYLGHGMSDTAVIVAEAAVHEALTIAAWPRDRRVAEKSPERIAHDLVTQGLMDAEDYETVRATRRLRDMALVSGKEAPVTKQDVLRALDLAAALPMKAAAPAAH